MKVDISKIRRKVDSFNLKYGCQFDIDKYEDALEETINDTTPERIDKVYKDTIIEICNQALKSTIEGKIEAPSFNTILKEFENDIFFPLIMTRRMAGYDTVARENGGMSLVERNAIAYQFELDAFNAKYGCEFDVAKYEEKLKECSKDRKNEANNINALFKDAFAEIHKQAIKNSPEKISDFKTSMAMLDDFDKKILFPVLRTNVRRTDLISSFGGMTPRERENFLNELGAVKAEVIVERPSVLQPAQVDYSKLTSDIQAFNTTYGVKFDLKKYVNSLNKYINDRSPERRNNLYREIFNGLYAQALKNVSANKIRSFSAKTMLSDFQNDIIGEIFEIRSEAGIDEITDSFGGMTKDEIDEFVEKHDKAIFKDTAKKSLKQYDLKQVKDAVNAFNQKYGCKLDPKKYKDALTNFATNDTPENINNVYKEMFSGVFKQAMRSALEGKIQLNSGIEMLNDFEQTIMAPIREGSGSIIAQPFGGMSSSQQFDFLRECFYADDVPTTTITQHLEKYQTGKVTLDQIHAFATEIFENPQTMSDETKTQFMLWVMVLERAADIHSDLKPKLAEQEQGYIKVYYDTFMHYFGAGQYSKYRLQNSKSLKNVETLEREISSRIPNIKKLPEEEKDNDKELQKEYENRLNQNKNDVRVEQPQIIEQNPINKADDKVVQDNNKEVVQDNNKEVVQDNNVKEDNKIDDVNKEEAKNELDEKAVKEAEDKKEDAVADNDGNKEEKIAHENDQKVNDEQINNPENKEEVKELENKEEVKEPENKEVIVDDKVENPNNQEIQAENSNNKQVEGEVNKQAEADDNKQVAIGVNEAEQQPEQQPVQPVQPAKVEEQVNTDDEPTPTFNVMEAYKRGDFPLRRMRALADNIGNSPAYAIDEDKILLAACISAIENVHSTRTTKWMFQNVARYYSEYRDAKNMKAIFVDVFGKDQYEMYKVCADTGVTVEEYKKATGISDRHPREKMDFGEEFAENKNIPRSQPKEINPVSVKSKNEPNIN